MRTIINLRALNQYVVAEKFKMETLDSCLTSLKTGMYAIKIDLKDAYFQVMVHPAYRKYLRIAVEHKTVKYTLQFRVLPFGLSSSPYAFTKICTRIGQHLRENGVQVFQYLDDWILYSQDRAQLRLHTDWTLGLLKQLGVVINYKKSILTPTQNVEFLGSRIDLKRGQVRPKEANVCKMVSLLREMSKATSWSASLWMRLIGMLNFSSKFLPLGRLRLRPLQLCLLGQWKPASQPMNAQVSVHSGSCFLMI